MMRPTTLFTAIGAWSPISITVAPYLELTALCILRCRTTFVRVNGAIEYRSIVTGKDDGVQTVNLV
jgi:hypothetical protein